MQLQNLLQTTQDVTVLQLARLFMSRRGGRGGGGGGGGDKIVWQLEKQLPESMNATCPES